MRNTQAQPCICKFRVEAYGFVVIINGQVKLPELFVAFSDIVISYRFRVFVKNGFNIGFNGLFKIADIGLTVCLVEIGRGECVIYGKHIVICINGLFIKINVAVCNSKVKPCGDGIGLPVEK